ncbi:MAG TPA: hydroxymethylbilane synthase [Lacipirellulaceae bacterium]|nr:hydroxymethylbilane synthase [Lacipirellulaceae bacterium]
MARSRPLRIGTRGSKLARWQSDWVAARLREAGAQVDVVEIATTGDVEQLGPVAALGTGVFTKEIQAALLAGAVDVAVHSLKDLPTQSTAGVALAATPVREVVDDALIGAAGRRLSELPSGSRVGTGSLRRRAQLLCLRPDLAMLEIRGNVDTRLRKLDAGQYDAIVLAAAGLRRLGLDGRISELLAPPGMLPAPGQGALGIECRADDATTAALLAPLDDLATRWSVSAERALLAELEGGCSAPVAAWGRVLEGRLVLDGLVADADGRQALRASGEALLAVAGRSDADGVAAAAELGRRLARELLAQGAAALMGRTGG